MNSKKKVIFLLPGMLAPMRMVMPLCKYLRKSQDGFSVMPLSLKLSLGSFEKIVSLALSQIVPLLERTEINHIVLFGHSHGGRVAIAINNNLIKSFPEITCDVIMASSPVIRKPEHLVWYRRLVYSFSDAFRSWPVVQQPTGQVGKYICYYSTVDEIVDVESIMSGFSGELRELKGFTHHDFLMPSKMGPVILEELNSQKNRTDS